MAETYLCLCIKNEWQYKAVSSPVLMPSLELGSTVVCFDVDYHFEYMLQKLCCVTESVFYFLKCVFQPMLPSNAICQICNQGDGARVDEGVSEEQLTRIEIMECRICFDIVHPLCLKKSHPEMSHPGVIDEDLPSSWECARCCEAGKEGQGKVSFHLFLSRLEIGFLYIEKRLLYVVVVIHFLSPY